MKAKVFRGFESLSFRQIFLFRYNSVRQGRRLLLAVPCGANQILEPFSHAGIAQLAERLFCNQGVAGSIPAAGPISFDLKGNSGMNHLAKNLQPYVALAHDLCEDEGGRLLFLTEFGAPLYGLATPNSDTDIQGVFMPSRKKFLTGQSKRFLSWKTADDARKNTSRDVDLSLFSLDEFLLSQLKRPSILAVDILFAPTNPQSVLFMDPLYGRHVFEQRRSLVPDTYLQACCEYALSQVRKHLYRGNRLWTLQKVSDFMKALPITSEGLSLRAVLPQILEICGHDNENCHEDGPFLNFLGAKYPLETMAFRFRSTVEKKTENFREALDFATEGRTADLKAFSHAYRAMFQAEDFFHRRGFSFPLTEREKIFDIKSRKYDIETVCEMVKKKEESLKSSIPRSSNQEDCINMQQETWLNFFEQGYPRKAHTKNADASPCSGRLLFSAESGSVSREMDTKFSDRDVTRIYAMGKRSFFSTARNIDRKQAGTDIRDWELLNFLSGFLDGKVDHLELMATADKYISYGLSFARELRPYIPEVFDLTRYLCHYSGHARTTLKGIEKKGFATDKDVKNLLRAFLNVRLALETKEFHCLSPKYILKYSLPGLDAAFRENALSFLHMDRTREDRDAVLSDSKDLLPWKKAFIDEVEALLNEEMPKTPKPKISEETLVTFGRIFLEERNLSLQETEHSPGGRQELSEYGDTGQDPENPCGC